MATIYLIDHSLKGVGGHHFEYALHAGRAALSAGYDTVRFGTHASYEESTQLDDLGQVYPFFPNDTYSPFCAFFRQPYIEPSREKQLGRRMLRKLVEPFRSWGRTSGRRSHIEQFRDACGKLFSAAPLAPGDVVFFPTVSELDLEGLAEFISEEPITKQIDWRLQFHFDVFDGRPCEYEPQVARLNEMRESFRRSLQLTHGCRLSMYNTTPEMTAQYQRLQVGRFETLPYPVNPAINCTPPGEQQDRLRVTCAGYFRREKGRRHFNELVEGLGEDLASGGRLQLVVQGSPKQIRRALGSSLKKIDAVESEAIVTPPHPLSMEQYSELIQKADIGLLLYDGRRYYARCSGVLVEMLAAGAPVIVPAGCWLSEQIALVNQRRLRLISQGPNVRSTALAAHQSGQVIESECLRDPLARDVVIRFSWSTPELPGAYARVRCRQLNTQGRVLTDETVVVEHGDGDTVATLFALDDNAASISTTFQNAYHSSPNQQPLTIYNAQAYFPPGNTGDAHLPLGCVGLTFDKPGDIPRLVRDMAEHIEHYRSTAEQFSATWRHDHHPERIFDRFAEASAKAA